LRQGKNDKKEREQREEVRFNCNRGEKKSKEAEETLGQSKNRRIKNKTCRQSRRTTNVN
jgi:hypothetical protein